MEWLRSRIRAIPRGHDVAVLIQAPAGRVRWVVGQWGEVEPVGDGACRLRMNTDDLSWPAMVLGTIGADFTIESPDALRDFVRSAAETLLRGVRATVPD